MSETAGVLLSLLVVFVSSSVAGLATRRLIGSSVVGWVVAGVVVGPSIAGWVKVTPALATMSTLGIVILMFSVGLEENLERLFEVGLIGLTVAATGVVLPVAAGTAALLAQGTGWHGALMAGTALAATSVGVTAGVLEDLKILRTKPARVILSAAVIDDILGLIVLSVVLGIESDAGWRPAHLLGTMGIALVFVAFELLVAPRVLAKPVGFLQRRQLSDALLVLAMAAMLGLGLLAELAGLAAIVGAFLAGLAFAGISDRQALGERLRPLRTFMVPFFFAVTGVQVDLQQLLRPAVLLPGLGLIALAILTKLVGCGAAALSLGRRNAVIVGVGMVPRGEVGLIVATTGLTTGILSRADYSAIVLVVLVTTLFAPLMLPLAAKRLPKDTAPCEEPACRL